MAVSTCSSRPMNLKRCLLTSRMKKRSVSWPSSIWIDPQCLFSTPVCLRRIIASQRRSTTATMNFSTLIKRLNPCSMSWSRRPSNKPRWKSCQSMKLLSSSSNLMNIKRSEMLSWSKLSVFKQHMTESLLKFQEGLSSSQFGKQKDAGPIKSTLQEWSVKTGWRI